MHTDDTLIGASEAAKLLGIGQTNFSHLQAKERKWEDSQFPEPIARLACGPIWLEADMLRFKEHYDARRRRPVPNPDLADLLKLQEYVSVLYSRITEVIEELVSHDAPL